MVFDPKNYPNLLIRGKALTYGSQTLSERIMPIIKERNDLGTPQNVRPYTL